jgi:hypothetical protein
MESTDQLDWRLKAIEQKDIYYLYHDREFLKSKVLELKKHLDSFTFFSNDPDLPRNPNKFTSGEYHKVHETIIKLMETYRNLLSMVSPEDEYYKFCKEHGFSAYCYRA